MVLYGLLLIMLLKSSTVESRPVLFSTFCTTFSLTQSWVRASLAQHFPAQSLWLQQFARLRHVSALSPPAPHAKYVTTSPGIGYALLPDVGCALSFLLASYVSSSVPLTSLEWNRWILYHSLPTLLRARLRLHRQVTGATLLPSCLLPQFSPACCSSRESLNRWSGCQQYPANCRRPSAPLWHLRPVSEGHLGQLSGVRLVLLTATPGDFGRSSSCLLLKPPKGPHSGSGRSARRELHHVLVGRTSCLPQTFSQQSAHARTLRP